MICQNCKSAPASVCITQIVDSQKTDTYLCQSCANDSAMKLQTPLGLFDVPGHLVFGADFDRLVKQAGNERCEGCGITFAEIQKTGKLGCAKCYYTFRAKLRPIITRIHRSAQHRGKNPSGADESGSKSSGSKSSGEYMPGTPGAPFAPGPNAYGEDESGTVARGANDSAGRVSGAPYFSGSTQMPDISTRVLTLKASLAEAIRIEDYEKAAELRDKIKALEKS